jgi:FlaA1/EpsC-like NDP-sugar epimerase
LGANTKVKPWIELSIQGLVLKSDFLRCLFYRENYTMPEEQLQPPQTQEAPGVESQMTPKPKADDPQYKGSDKLKDKVALITGADSGIGRAVAIAFAKEGANVAILYLSEHDDAKETKHLVESLGRRAVTIAGDIGDETFC